MAAAERSAGYEWRGLDERAQAGRLTVLAAVYRSGLSVERAARESGVPLGQATTHLHSLGIVRGRIDRGGQRGTYRPETDTTIGRGAGWAHEDCPHCGPGGSLCHAVRGHGGRHTWQ